jgi:hypothetical protein
VAPDGTGAFTIRSGAEDVACPGATVQPGMTLRWPPESPPVTARGG